LAPQISISLPSIEEARKMQRRRYQRGHVFLRGKKGQRVWVGRYLEGVSENGKRINKSVVLGSEKEFSGKKMALRALEPYLAKVNDINYRPATPITFEEFAKSWKETILPTVKKGSFRRDISSQLHKHLVPNLGKIRLTDITPRELQQFILTVSPGRQRHVYMTFKKLWKTATEWGYVNREIKGIQFTPYDKEEQRFFTLEEVRMIFAAAAEPWKTLYWVVIETGLRIGEVLALRFKNVDVEGQILSVESSAWEGKTNTPKTKTGIRRIPLSCSLTSRLSVLCQKKCSDCFIFSSKRGTPLRPNNILRRHHYPLLDRLRIPRGGFHAFRHASASFMDQLNVPMAIRQKRLGHADIATTMKYTHSVSEEERRVSEQLGKYLSLDLGLDFNPSFPKLPSSTAPN
jgi:integrase